MIRHKQYWQFIITVSGLLFSTNLNAQTLLRSFRSGNFGNVNLGGVEMGGSYYFPATSSDGNGNGQLWKTDGTAAGTSNVATFPGGFPSNPVLSFNNQVYFLAETPNQGQELWQSNGTSAGTSSVRDIKSGVQSSFFDDQSSTGIEFKPRVVNGVMLFAANDGVNGKELWRTDGTTMGTVLLKDIYPGSGGSGVTLGVENSIQIGNIIYFTANDATGRSLFRTDGTTSGTYRLLTGNVNGLANMNGTLYFIKCSGANKGVWKSNGTVESTLFVSVAGLNSTPDICGAITPVSSDLFFYFGRTPSTVANYFALYKSDGTASGTQLVKDNLFGINDVSPVSGRLFFRTAGTSTSSSGFSLWQSDGTPAGTGVYQEHNTSNGENAPFQVYFVNNRCIYVWRMPGISGSGLYTWITDGTAAGTRPLKNHVADNSPFWVNQAGFVANRYILLVNGEIWTSDGTTASTAQATQFRTLFGETRTADSFVELNGLLLIRNTQNELFAYQFPTINAPLINAQLCVGQTAAVTYQIQGAFQSGNIFSAQLSDASGSFAAPVTIGSITSTTSGTISVTIPQNTVVGGGYRVRIVSSVPVITNSPFTVLEIKALCQCLLNTSLMSGNWSSPGIWSCGRVPIVTDPVRISAGHTVAVDINNATSKSLSLWGKVQYQAGSKLRVVP